MVSYLGDTRVDLEHLADGSGAGGAEVVLVEVEVGDLLVGLHSTGKQGTEQQLVRAGRE